jgi:hypothetical protein
LYQNKIRNYLFPNNRNRLVANIDNQPISVRVIASKLDKIRGRYN